MNKYTKIFFELLSDKAIIFKLIFWPVFSLSSYLINKRLKNSGVVPNTIIDVGANIGQFTVSASKIFCGAKIYSFEPVNKSYETLKNNVSNISGVEVFNCGLGETSSNMPININSHSHSSSFLKISSNHRKAYPSFKEVAQQNVQVDTLDNVFAEEVMTGPILLKLDVQGYEAKVLEGGQEILKEIDYVVAELSFDENYEGEVLFSQFIKLMGQYGYRFLKPVGMLEHVKTREILQVDALFVKN